MYHRSVAPGTYRTAFEVRTSKEKNILMLSSWFETFHLLQGKVIALSFSVAVYRFFVILLKGFVRFSIFSFHEIKICYQWKFCISKVSEHTMNLLSGVLCARCVK